ncbi:hypothetical protein CTRI78_v000440 [Colletotrichum trifolii]|uniref:Uncharacterized protein n=1 Tax=Colletotrichum trifolii TaxID=5466 RepID=A0A4R8RSC2_COLTR|nr:hypothetical protein CTRI78_v000440 [Colletotrichum trifolii]
MASKALVHHVDGESPVPFEVFLIIVEKLIENATSTLETQIWTLSYDHDEPSKLAVYQNYCLHYYTIGPKLQLDQRIRFNTIRLPSQINQQCRRMVHRTFRRFPIRAGQGVSHPGIKAWVHTARDVFTHPTIRRDSTVEDDSTVALSRGRLCALSILLPTAEASTYLTEVTNFGIFGFNFFHSQNSLCVASVLSLPNIKRVFWNIGEHFGDPIFHSNPQPFDRAALPDLAEWHDAEGPFFYDVWKPFAARGIPLIGMLIGIKGPVFTMKPTKDDIIVESVPSLANCNCCKKTSNEAETKAITSA